jgi:hypothetical protein
LQPLQFLHPLLLALQLLLRQQFHPALPLPRGLRLPLAHDLLSRAFSPDCGSWSPIERRRSAMAVF